jgi:hypothetical protein
MRSTRGLYVLGGFCLLLCSARTSAQEQAGAAAPVVVEPAPDAAGREAVAAPPAPAPDVEPAPVVQSKPARKKRAHSTVPVAPAAPDPERPLREVSERADPSPVTLRLGLGVGAALWFDGGDAELFEPVPLSLVAGYALDRNLAIVVRASTWLKTAPLANEFYGAGVLYRFAGDMSVLATLGAGFTRYADFARRLQGVAIQADVGQGFSLAEHWDLVLGAHFQVGTALGGSAAYGFNSIETGIFVAVDYL